MALDFQQLQQKIKQMGETAKERDLRIATLTQRAQALLEDNAQNFTELRQKVFQALSTDPTLRCALPVDELVRQPEPLNACFPLPAAVDEATLLAADGSQIIPNRHEQAYYGLINAGTIQMQLGSPQAPTITLDCELLYGDILESNPLTQTEAHISLMRDLRERNLLARLAENAAPPAIALTDGPIEFAGSREYEETAEFKESREEHLAALRKLSKLGTTLAGYVDKPAANLVVRLLELASLPESDLKEKRRPAPLRGVTDRALFNALLPPGTRSAVFGYQSWWSKYFRDELALHFFYLNVGRLDHPALARVEFPAWVAASQEKTEKLHAILIAQCRLMGNRPYPYILHRAHEAAVISLEERQQATQMIVQELRRRGIDAGDKSNKQSAKELPGRAGYRS